MSSFFTLPASQRKRKRTKPSEQASKKARREPSDARSAKRRQPADEDISSGESGDDAPAATAEDSVESQSEESEAEGEDAAGRRTRLAERYLENTKNEVLAEGFDAEDIDRELLAARTGQRLKEDTAESKGKLYRWIAADLDIANATHAQFRADTKAVTGVAACPPCLYTVSKDITLIKWELPGQAQQVNGDNPIKMSRKPKQLLYTKGNGKNKLDPHAQHHTGPILCVAASSDGRFVATGGGDNKLIVWDAATLKPLKFFSQHRDSITSLAFRRGTNQLFSASKDRTIKIWSLDELAYVETLFGHQDEVVGVDALAAEKCVTVGARDRTARLWKVVEESQLVFRGGGGGGKSKRPRDGDSMDIDAVNVYNEGSMDRIAMIDDETFVTGSDNGSLSLWNIHKKKPVFTYTLAHGEDPPLPLGEASAELHPDPKLLQPPQPRWITALKAVPFSDVLISGSWDGFVRAWKVSDDKRSLVPLGPLGCVEGTVEKMLDSEGLSSDSLANGALDAMAEALERQQGAARGVINDLAIFERGERGKDGIAVVVALGKEHRLGRWTQVKGKNGAVVFEMPRKVAAAAADEEFENGVKETGSDFGGFED